jgi:putative DNA primase/helicase
VKAALLDLGRQAHAAKLCVMPPKQDGSKAPDADTWTVYQQRISTLAEIEEWYAGGDRTGIGFITGAVSGNLELLDFDESGLYARFREAARAAGLDDLVEQIEAGYAERTAHGGHLLYRCSGPVKSMKLARRPKRPEEMQHPNDRVKTLVETKGEGGYVIVAPSNGSVNPDGKYELVRGGIATIATITPEERESLHEVARSFDQMPRSVFTLPCATEKTSGWEVRPGDDFSQRTTWHELLEAYGWCFVYSRGETDYWRRPGKDRGISATTNYDGSDLLYLFSTSTQFDADRGYSRFSAYTILEHKGDFVAAAKTLFARGYGKPAQSSSSAEVHDRSSLAAQGEAPDRYNLTDLGNAERLVTRYGHDLRYNAALGWLVFDGRRWQRDEGGNRMLELAARTVRGMYDAVAQEDNADRRQALAKHATRSEAAARINAMIDLARAIRGISVDVELLDTNPWLLNVANGTVDFRDGLLNPHRREDYITKLIDLDFDQAIDCLLWQRVLERVLPDPEVRAFVQRAIGYSASGSARERCVLICYGSGKNGKGVLLQTVRNVLGEYAVRTPSTTFVARRGDAIPNDIAQLRGARFVFTSETADGQRLDEGLVKDLTGGEDVSARFMRGEWFSFTPTFTPWLATNHRPVIRGTDEAIWDRIRLIPFNVRIPEAEQDRQLIDKLKSEAIGILTWIIEGAVDWYQNGLSSPKEVQVATSTYRTEMDTLGGFIEDRCVVDAGLSVTAKALYEAYRAWCEACGERSVAQTAFGLRLAERGFASTRAGGRERTRMWRGIGLSGVERQEGAR